MHTRPLDPSMIASFVHYCAHHGPEHDDSYLPGDDFAIDEDNPTVLLLDVAETLTGVASLMMGPAFRAAGRGRFRILHALEPSPDQYAALLSAILPLATRVSGVYLFLPDSKSDSVGRIIQNCGFAVERYSWILGRPTAGIRPAAFPPGFVVRPVSSEREEALWCTVANIALASLPGHVNITPQDLHAMVQEPEHLEDGLLLLWREDVPVGTVRVTGEDTACGCQAFIYALGILPEYRGRGLGRSLLRAAGALALDHGLARVGLCVNSTNEQAVALYLSEGFEKEETYLCYGRALGSQVAQPAEDASRCG